MTTLVLLHTGVVGVRRVGKQVRLLALDGRNAELAGGLSSNPILSGLRRTETYYDKLLVYVPIPKAIR
jgi:hypothetical protein